MYGYVTELSESIYLCKKEKKNGPMLVSIYYLQNIFRYDIFVIYE